MNLDSIKLKKDPLAFRLSDELDWSDFADSREFKKILLGQSEEGRKIWAFKLGHGPSKISLLAGCHSDEPLGPEMLRRLVKEFHDHQDQLNEVWERYTFYILPHINPDGEKRNVKWMKDWPNFEAYLSSAFREPPGRDVEFGFPKMRRENELWSNWLEAEGPFQLHISFHGMGYSEGNMLLIEKHWIDRTQKLRKAFEEKSLQAGYLMHDHDREGDKGFLYISPGFTTTPEGVAMKEHFVKAGDSEMAEKFHLSSMEWIRSLGGDPRCLVTELPLFCIQKREGRQKGLPVHHLSLKEARKKSDFRASDAEKSLNIQHLSIGFGLEMQLFVLQQALKAFE
jgi:hypothetical protein